jgi:acyl carrier protein
MSTTPSVNDALTDNTAAVRRVIIDVLLANKTAHVSGPEAVSDDVVLGSGGLGISSLLLLHVFVKLEESFGFAFEDAAVANAKFLTVGDFVSFVTEAVHRRRATNAGSA